MLSDPELIESMKTAAVKNAKNFSIEGYAKTMLNIYESVMK